MAVATQARPQTQAAQTAVAGADLEKVLIQTEKDLAALRDRIDNSHPGLSRAVATSSALQRARALVTPRFLEDYVLPLMNSPLGFMTDKNGSKNPSDLYRPADLIEPIAECLIRGFNIAGNEMNVIAGRFYGAQNGYRRLVRELPGLTDLEEIPGEPVAANGNTCVRFIIRCKMNGKEWVLKNEKGEPGRKFTIRVNSGMGPDAILGKAARKALKAAYEELTGTALTESDEADVSDKTAPPEIPAGRSKIGGNGSGNGHAKAAPAQEPPLDTAGGEIPNEATTEPSVPPAETGTLVSEADIEAVVMQLQDDIDAVANDAESNKVGAALNTAKSIIGQARYDALLGMLQAANRVRTAAKKK